MSPPDQATASLAEEIVDTLNAVNGSHAGHRAVHAKGTVCTGTFTPTPEAGKLSRAAHLRGDPVRATVRFSNASGHPETSDANPIAGRGMAIKFHLPDGESTDIVSVPLVVFMVRNPEDFLALTKARVPDPDTGQPDPEKMGAFLRGHPETGIALQKGFPNLAPTTSFVTSDYNALHAFALVDESGERHWGRYLWRPPDGHQSMGEDEAKEASDHYLQDEIRERLAGDGTATLRLDFMLAKDGDPLDDPTVEWEGDHEVVTLGELVLNEVIEDPETPEEPLVFDPMRLTEGLEPSEDKILAIRPVAYSVSIDRRCASG